MVKAGDKVFLIVISDGVFMARTRMFETEDKQVEAFKKILSDNGLSEGSDEWEEALEEGSFCTDNDDGYDHQYDLQFGYLE